MNCILKRILPILLFLLGSFSWCQVSLAYERVISKESFEKGIFNGTDFQAGSGVITNDPSKVVSGSYSVYASSPSTQEWTNLAYSDSNKVKFEKYTTYSVTFSYKAVEQPPASKDGYFYFLARSTDRDITKDLAWTAWTAEAGSMGTKTIVFTTGGEDNYFLIWGIHNGGALSIDDIKLEVNAYQYDINGRLIRYYTPDFRVINFYYDTNGNLIKKTKN